MKYIARWVLSALLVLLTLWGLWYFADIVMYILISAVLSFMGHPLVRFFDRMHFRGVRIPHSLSAGLALIVELVVVLAIIGTLVPLVARQASIISGIDANTVAQAFREPLMWLEEVMIEYGLMSSTETLESYVTGRLQEVFVAIDFSQVLDILFSLTGTVFIGLFSVVFITYFFLKEKDLFQNGIMLFTPEKYHKEVDNILTSTRYLLSRYFLGICLEILIMMTMITAFLTILGVKGALLIGFLGGLMNIIPYLGPVIGAILGVLIGASTQLSLGVYADLYVLIFKIVGSFSVAKLIDDMVLQPMIYSKSVKAHPLEIFLVIMIAGSLAGVPGMMLAIPSYTVLRIVAKEFLSGMRVVKKLTEDI